MNQYRIELKNFLDLGVTDDVFNDDSKFNHLAPNFNVGFNFFTHGFFLGVSAYNFLPFSILFLPMKMIFRMPSPFLYLPDWNCQ